MTDLELVRRVEDLIHTYVFKNSKDVIMYDRALLERKFKELREEYLKEKGDDKNV